MLHATNKAGLSLPNRQLTCSPVTSELGKRYFAAMSCAATYGWDNRQLLTHWTREIMEKTLSLSPRELQMQLVYDVCHDIAKKEVDTVDGEQRKVCVHRKGATRGFPRDTRMFQRYTVMWDSLS